MNRQERVANIVQGWQTERRRQGVTRAGTHDSSHDLHLSLSQTRIKV